MPPQWSKHYPLTASLSNSCPSVFPNRKALPFNSSTSLARYQKEDVVPYLKNVVHHLKEYLDFFPQIILHWRLSVRTIESERGVEQQLSWELTIQQRIKHASNKLEALMILQQGLFQNKILLNFVDSYQKHDLGCVQKFSEKEVEKLKRLKENLLELSKFLDCVLLFFSNTDLSCKLPEVSEVQRTTKKLNKVIRFLTPDKIKELIPEGTFTEEDVLCSVLGFNDNFAERLRNVSKEMRSHQTDMYFLLSFMEELYDSCNEESLRDTAAVERRLREMCFTESRANVIAKWISEQPFAEHKSLLNWAQIYIENLFKYDIFLNDHVKDFPYEEKRLNEWFDVSVERDISDCDNHDGVATFIKVPVINTTKEQATSRLREKIPEFEAEQPKQQLYFHGTDHKGAKDILENGIKLSYGRKGCDFSDGNGFYVADVFQYSLDWTIDKSDASAVMIFRIDDDCLKTCRGLDLSLSNRSEDLKTVRDYFKSGQKKQKCTNKRLMNEVRNCDYITGPISRDGTKKDPRQVVQQICIKKDDVADEVGKHIVGIVFLRKKGNQLARRK